MRILGLDIGGANVKVATQDGFCLTIALPIWKDPNQLLRVLQELPAKTCGNPEMVALTMTAELADCFQNRSDGVRFVIDTVVAAFPGVPVRVWMNSGEFAEPEDAAELPTLVAAANWHLLATWVGRAVPEGPALLIDSGSTTTDIIPLLDGLPISTGRTDLERLASRELVYSGASRTPVCAMVRQVPMDGCEIPLAAELFATSLDIHIVCGNAPEKPDDCNTADGRPATCSNSLNRLAHMLCSDMTEISEQQLVSVAEWIAEKQFAEIAAAISNRLEYLKNLCGDHSGRQVNSPVILISGSGEFLATEALARIPHVADFQVLRLSEMSQYHVTEAACAFAAARLCADRCLDDLLPLLEF